MCTPLCPRISRENIGFLVFLGVKCVISSRSRNSGTQAIVIQFDIGNKTWHIKLFCFAPVTSVNLVILLY